MNAIDNVVDDKRIASNDAERLVRLHGARILDVRTTTEFRAAHIPGSYNVPLDQIAEHAVELSRVDEPVILVCRSGARAARAEAALRMCGMTHAKIMQGGIVEWEATGLPVRRDASRWDLERQVRFTAGLIVLLSVVGGLLIDSTLYLVAGAIGAGLVGAALTNTCMMGMLLLRLPFNRTAPTCTVGDSVAGFVGSKSG